MPRVCFCAGPSNESSSPGSGRELRERHVAPEPPQKRFRPDNTARSNTGKVYQVVPKDHASWARLRFTATQGMLNTLE